MRCRICGAPLKKPGDICSNCYKEYQEDENLKKDVKEIYKLKRKYSIAYELLKYMGLILIFFICIIVFFFGKAFLEGVLTILLFLITLGVLLFLDKRIAVGTQATFYEKKVVYRFHFWFLKREKIVKYKDITDISYYQTFRQKRMGYGDLCIYARGNIPGATLLNGFQVKNVENVKEVLQTLKEMLQTNEN